MTNFALYLLGASFTFLGGIVLLMGGDALGWWSLCFMFVLMHLANMEPERKKP